MPKDKLLSKARSKYLSKNFALKLHEANKTSIIAKSYRNTFYCCNEMYDQEGMLKSKYCKNRWCAVCNRIRTAQIMNRYITQLAPFEEPMFVTLTLPTVHQNHLSQRIKLMGKEWSRIIDVTRRKPFERLGIKRPIGIRKSECTARPGNRCHFHYHLIVDGADTGSWIHDQWLDRFPAANRKAQDVRPADERSLKELFKYFSKVTYKGKLGALRTLDAIFRGMRGKRVYQPFGGLKMAPEEITDDLIKKLEKPKHIDGMIFRWNDEMTDWISEYGELLTNYRPSERLKRFFDDREGNTI